MGAVVEIWLEYLIPFLHGDSCIVQWRRLPQRVWPHKLAPQNYLQEERCKGTPALDGHFIPAKKSLLPTGGGSSTVEQGVRVHGQQKWKDLVVREMV